MTLDDGAASYGGPANFSGRLHDAAASWDASGDLDFMNEWYVLSDLSGTVTHYQDRTYKLGEERTSHVTASMSTALTT